MGVALIWRIRYADIPCSSVGPRTTSRTRRANRARCRAACPAELAPPIDANVFARQRGRLDAGRTVEDPPAHETLDRGDLHPPVRDADRDDNCTGDAPAGHHPARRPGGRRARRTRGCCVGEHELSPEQQRLLPRAVRERGARRSRARSRGSCGSGSWCRPGRRSRVAPQRGCADPPMPHTPQPRGQRARRRTTARSYTSAPGSVWMPCDEASSPRLGSCKTVPSWRTDGGQRLDVDPQLADEPSAALGLDCVELERHAVTRQDVARARGCAGAHCSPTMR